MIRALRRTCLAPLFAVIALFAMTPVTVTSLLHDESDDAICNPAVVIHDANAHRVTSSDRNSALPDSQHCVLCHTLQLRAVSASIRFAAPASDARLIAAAAISGLSAALSSSRPARAPPIA